MSKFKLGDVVVYCKGDTWQLGIVKAVVASGGVCKYRVMYHEGDTSALTYENDLHSIENGYAFLILKRQADTSSIDTTHARQLAACIIDSIPALSKLTGKAYYDVEDSLTNTINNYSSKEYMEGK